MDFLGWIAASQAQKFETSWTEERIHAHFLTLKRRGFLTDFLDRPIVADVRTQKIVIARQSSFFGRLGSVRCVVKVLPRGSETGRLLFVRVWHAPFTTAWFLLSYALAGLVVLVSVGAIFQGRETGERIATALAGAIVGGVWFVLTAGFNGVLRAVRRGEIEELLAGLSAMKSDEIPLSTPRATQR